MYAGEHLQVSYRNGQLRTENPNCRWTPEDRKTSSGLMSLDFFCDTQDEIRRKQHVGIDLALFSFQ